MDNQKSLINNFGLMLAQLPKREIALAVFREAIRTKNQSLIHMLLHSLSQDLGNNYVSKWIVEDALPTLSLEEINYLEQKVLSSSSLGEADDYSV
ncbi:hypothetical protein [Pleurocapsa sp. PCC 7319]|uniref:hypothetical protein n=1 Tax=Pleurocapsa sp. PCC 7319 TaxID=118161 RepID=UPI0003479DAA|nr:hypothetical protein [Pleurocapsa sp. PCC 7319]